jgi:DNA primase large subunit
MWLTEISWKSETNKIVDGTFFVVCFVTRTAETWLFVRVRTRSKRVAWRLSGYQVAAGNTILTKNKQLIKVAA